VCRLTAEEGATGDRLLPSAHGFRSIIALWGGLILGTVINGRRTSLAIESVPRGVAVVGRVIHAYHAALALDPGGSAAGLLNFLFRSAARYAQAGAVEAILCWIALVVGSSTHDMPAGHLMTLGPPQGSCFFPLPADCACVPDFP